MDTANILAERDRRECVVWRQERSGWFNGTRLEKRYNFPNISDVQTRRFTNFVVSPNGVVPSN